MHMLRRRQRDVCFSVYDSTVSFVCVPRSSGDEKLHGFVVSPVYSAGQVLRKAPWVSKTGGHEEGADSWCQRSLQTSAQGFGYILGGGHCFPLL